MEIKLKGLTKIFPGNPKKHIKRCKKHRLNGKYIRNSKRIFSFSKNAKIIS